MSHIQKTSFALLMLLAFLSGIGKTIIFAIVPPIARDLNITEFYVGVIFSASAFFWVLCAPKWGRLSDRKGRKSFILVGVAGLTSSMLVFSLVWQAAVSNMLSGPLLVIALIFSRVIYGIFGSAGPSSAQAYIADHTSDSNRFGAIARYTAAHAFGTILGPGFAASVSLVFPAAPFLLIAVIGIVLWPVLFFRLQEINTFEQHHEMTSIQLKDHRIRPYLLYGLGIGIITIIPMQTTALYFIDHLGYALEFAPQAAGLGLTASAVCSLAAQLTIVGKSSFSPITMIRIAPVLFILGNFLIWGFSEITPVLLGLMLTGFSTGLALPSFTAAVSLAVSHHEQGGAMGIANAYIVTGQIISPLIALSLYEISPRYPYLLSLVIAAFLLVFTWGMKFPSAD